MGDCQDEDEESNSDWHCLEIGRFDISIFGINDCTHNGLAVLVDDSCRRDFLFFLCLC